MTILTSLEINNFRNFNPLIITQLSRVNLFVGKNNIGKTSLLEAIWLYAKKGSPHVLRTILEARDEIKMPTGEGTGEAVSQVLSIRYLFHGRNEGNQGNLPIYIGPINNPDLQLSLSVLWHKQQENDNGVIRLIPIQTEEFEAVENPILGIVSRFGKQTLATRRLSRYFDRRVVAPIGEPGEIPVTFISANGPAKEDLVAWRDTSVIEGKKRYVLDALKIITEDVEDIDAVSGLRYDRSGSERIPVIKLVGNTNYIPLRSLGEGMNRLFALVLATVNSQHGILLVDEIENGLHYSIQHAVWKLLLMIARELNVQIFATTHSKDCVQAFSEAVSNAPEDGLLIRLGQKSGKVVTTIFDEEELEIANRQDIEIR